jgi:RES domain-containing protein
VQKAWRITKRRYASTAFDGEGARRYGGRWNSPGHAVVYVSETRALATLEILAGLQVPAVVPAYVLISVEFEEELISNVEVGGLPPDWRGSPPDSATQSIGDRWIEQASSLVLRVPSALVPGEFNYLINPAHAGFGKLRIGMPEELHRDPRILPR